MRILTCSYEFPPIGGGGAGVVHGLATQLGRAGHEVDVVTMKYRGLPARERDGNVRVYRVPSVRLRKDYCTAPELATYLASALPFLLRLARERDYDVNHTHFIFPDGLLAYLLHRIVGLPYIITAHGSDVPGYNPDRFQRMHRVLGPFWNAIVGRAERIVCPSESLRSLVLSRNPEAPALVVPNGIAVDRFRPDLPKKERILVLTRMFERKGVQYFLRALDGMELDHEISIVGDGPYLASLEDLAREFDLDVRFRGWLDRGSPELKHLFETSDIYVFTSEAENFPMVLLEAMVAGMAIITSSGTGCAEVVGDAALLVAARDVEGLGKALRRLIADPQLRARLGRQARKRVEENFSWPAVARQYERLFREVGGEP